MELVALVVLVVVLVVHDDRSSSFSWEGGHRGDRGGASEPPFRGVAARPGATALGVLLF